MANELQYVMLENGPYDRQVARAPMSPGTLRLSFLDGDSDGTLSALYLYRQGQTVVHRDHGEIPVMIHMRTDDAEPNLTAD